MTYIARNSAFALPSTGGEILVMSTADSRFFTLNPVAAAIWQAADGNTPLNEVSTRICAEFAVHYEVAHADAEEFIGELAASGLLLVSDRPILSEIPPVAMSPDSLAGNRSPAFISEAASDLRRSG